MSNLKGQLSSSNNQIKGKLNAMPFALGQGYNKEETDILLTQNLEEAKAYTDSAITTSEEALKEETNTLLVQNLEEAKAYTDTAITTSEEAAAAAYVKKTELPTIPTKTSELANDSNYQTEAEVEALIDTKLGVIENGSY